jgi:hypothetical protein
MRVMKSSYGTIRKQVSGIWNKAFCGAVWTEALIMGGSPLGFPSDLIQP